MAFFDKLANAFDPWCASVGKKCEFYSKQIPRRSCCGVKCTIQLGEHGNGVVEVGCREQDSGI